MRDFDRDDVDVGIRFGAGKYPGLAADRLFDNVLVPVCSPSLLRNGPPLKTPRDLFNHRLVHIEWSRQGVTWPNWRMWMAAAGIDDFDDSRTLVFGTSSDCRPGGDRRQRRWRWPTSPWWRTTFPRTASAQPFELGVTHGARTTAYFLVYPQRQRRGPAHRRSSANLDSGRGREKQADAQRRRDRLEPRARRLAETSLGCPRELQVFRLPPPLIPRDTDRKLGLFIPTLPPERYSPRSLCGNPVATVVRGETAPPVVGSTWPRQEAASKRFPCRHDERCRAGRAHGPGPTPIAQS